MADPKTLTLDDLLPTLGKPPKKETPKASLLDVILEDAIRKPGTFLDLTDYTAKVAEVERHRVVMLDDAGKREVTEVVGRNEACDALARFSKNPHATYLACFVIQGPKQRKVVAFTRSISESGVDPTWTKIA